MIDCRFGVLSFSFFFFFLELSEMVKMFALSRWLSRWVSLWPGLMLMSSPRRVDEDRDAPCPDAEDYVESLLPSHASRAAVQQF